MSTKQQRLETALAAIRAREEAKRPKPVEPVKPKKVRALPEPVFETVTAAYEPETVTTTEVVNELDAIGEGDQ
jgi:hypothetical protein